MKRNEDLIREILLIIERHPFDDEEDWINIWTDIRAHATKKISRCSNKEISYHIMLLDEAGLIRSIEISKNVWMPIRLTWAGHEFLDSARDDKRWKKVKSSMASIGGFVFDIAKPLLIVLAMGELNLK